MTWQVQYLTACGTNDSKVMMGTLCALENNPEFNHSDAARLIAYANAPTLDKSLAFNTLFQHFNNKLALGEVSDWNLKRFIIQYAYFSDYASFCINIISGQNLNRVAYQLQKTPLTLLFELIAVLQDSHFTERWLYGDYLNKQSILIDCLVRNTPENRRDMMMQNIAHIFVRSVSPQAWPAPENHMGHYAAFLDKFSICHDELIGRLAFAIEEPNFTLAFSFEVLLPLGIQSIKRFLRNPALRNYQGFNLPASARYTELFGLIDQFMSIDTLPDTPEKAILHFHEHEFVILPIYSSNQTGAHIEMLAFIDDYCIHFERGMGIYRGVTIYAMSKGEHLEETIKNFLFDNHQSKEHLSVYWFFDLTLLLGLRRVHTISQKSQTSGNCSMVAAKSMAWLVPFMMLYIDVVNLPEDERLVASMNFATEFYKKFTLANRFEMLQIVPANSPAYPLMRSKLNARCKKEFERGKGCPQHTEFVRELLRQYHIQMPSPPPTPSNTPTLSRTHSIAAKI